MRRRAFLAAGAVCVLAAPHVAWARAARRFAIWRDGDLIGEHTLDAVSRGGQFEIAIDIRIAVKVVGITAYRYTLANREVWSGGTIRSVASRVDDDGDKHFAEVAASDGGLSVRGSGFVGQIGPDAVTTSYFATPFLRRTPWLSTQSGTPLAIRVAPLAGRQGWSRVTGDLDIALLHDGAGEWTGCEFDAGGELASYELQGAPGGIAGLWAGA